MVCRTISRYYIVLAEQGQLDIHTGRAAAVQPGIHVAAVTLWHVNSRPQSSSFATRVVVSGGSVLLRTVA